MENQVIEKEKRTYKRVDLNEASFLTKIVAEKNLHIKSIADSIGISFATCKKYLINPALMNGVDRKKFSAILQIDIHEFSKMIDSM